MENEYLTYKQTMKYIGFNSYVTLNHLMKQGLPVIKFGKSKRISKSDIDKFMKDHTVVNSGVK